MKKVLLISVGTFTVLIALSVWAYLFTFGAPQNSAEVFTNFGIGGASIETIPRETSVVDIQDITPTGNVQNIKQLTTRPVAGAVFAGGGMRYVEQGTGHVYQINTTNGSESLISGATLLGAREAVFSRDGTHVAITLATENAVETLVGALSFSQDGSFAGKKLPVGATEVRFGDATSTVYYLLKNETGSHGYVYNIQKETTSQEFSIPLRDVHVLWGETTYVYTTPSATQEGTLYKVLKNKLRYVSDGGYGLMGFVHNATPITTMLQDDVSYSLATISEGRSIVVPVTVIPEKCVSGALYLYCAVPDNLRETDLFPDNWYKGALSYSDVLWRIEVAKGEATALSNILRESGREVDVSLMGIAPDESALYFINKNDNTLWMFDLQ